jgi:mRNA interferase YafQ
MLESEIELPAELHVHKLQGKYRGCMECHVENDFLLIWIDEKTSFIEVLRIGTHSELFDK